MAIKFISNTILTAVFVLVFKLVKAQCIDETDINFSFDNVTYYGKMCLGGLSDKSNCPNIPEGFVLIRPGYTPLYRNRTNTMIDYSNPTLIFDDEFDGSTIDENSWDLHTHVGAKLKQSHVRWA